MKSTLYIQRYSNGFAASMMDWSLYATLQSYAQADSYRKTYYMYALLNWTSVANCPRNNNESNQEINLSEFKLFVPKAFSIYHVGYLGNVAGRSERFG